jgi:hypothetical protein
MLRKLRERRRGRGLLIMLSASICRPAAERAEARRSAANRGELCEAAEFSDSQNRVFLCVMLVGLRGKLIMDTRFAFTLTLLLAGEYMFGCIAVAYAQAQQPLYTPGPPVPTAPGSNVPPPVPNAAPGSTVPPPVPSAAPESSVTSPVNEPRTAARTHKRTAVAKPVHHRGRSVVAGRTLPFYWRVYWDPRLPCCCCPIWNAYGPDYGAGWLMSRF